MIASSRVLGVHRHQKQKSVEWASTKLDCTGARWVEAITDYNSKVDHKNFGGLCGKHKFGRDGINNRGTNTIDNLLARLRAFVESTLRSSCM